MKNKKDALILIVCSLISVMTLPNLTKTLIEEFKNGLNKKKSIILEANVLVIDGERVSGQLSRDTTLSELTEAIFQGENLYRSYRIYVQNGCELYKAGNFTFFLLKKEEVKKSLASNIVPFIEGIPKMSLKCNGSAGAEEDVIARISNLESSSGLKVGKIFYFSKSLPLFSYHHVRLKGITP